MNITTITKNEDIPEELIDFKISHYKEIFREYWNDVYALSPKLGNDKELIVFHDLKKVVCGCSIEKGIYGVKFWDLSILPSGRGRGYSRIIMNYLEEFTRNHHYAIINSGDKPNDINQMFLRSLIYVNSIDSKENPVQQFSSFLKSKGFYPFIYNKNELSESEIKALEIYNKLYPDLSNNLRVFKKKVVDNGIELSHDIKEELLSLIKNPDKLDIVLGGLELKLKNYSKSGRISYRYDLCPICKDMGSSEVNSDNCKKCYIYKTCTLPFRNKGRFKEDFEVSQSYFFSMREFLLQNMQKRSLEVIP